MDITVVYAGWGDTNWCTSLVKSVKETAVCLQVPNSKILVVTK